VISPCRDRPDRQQILKSSRGSGAYDHPDLTVLPGEMYLDFPCSAKGTRSLGEENKRLIVEHNATRQLHIVPCHRNGTGADWGSDQSIQLDAGFNSRSTVPEVQRDGRPDNEGVWSNKQPKHPERGAFVRRKKKNESIRN